MKALPAGSRQPRAKRPALWRVLASVSSFERITLAIVAFAATAGFVFARLAGEMAEGETRAFDHALLLALRDPLNPAHPLGPTWLEEVMRDFTALGGTAVLALITLTVIAYLILASRRGTALMVGLSVAGGTVLSNALKWGFDRPRPNLVPHGMAVYSPSFPSGHAMMSAAVYLTIGALLARSEQRVRMRVFLLSVAAVLTLLVGFSRIYLGVHWPTDVMAGWLAGAAWASFCWLVMLWMQRMGRVEAEGPNANGPTDPA